MLLGLLCRDPSLAEDVRKDGVEGLLEGEAAREVVGRLCRLSPSDDRPDILAILNETDAEKVRRYLSEQILRADGPPGEARRLYPEVALGLRIRKARDELARLRGEIDAAQGETAQGLFTKMLDVRKELETLERQRRSRR